MPTVLDGPASSEFPDEACHSFAAFIDVAWSSSLQAALANPS